ncbi:L-asparaginase [Exiguobacterium sp. Leaf187]|uniref:asparaginase n=1 Tax=Exiguobacterium indicum TaxID=296995 RepID=A0A0V8GKE4_9BACL|nr:MULTISPECIES: asparaginase [Exiguobacterium]AHA30042.1 asparaginase [Exiguobacterium sp. MH3]KQS19285.1 L-asparaginase [Exiguobacterium sp. Leaf187]KSU50704.1 L-asparaginase [Exiguobacterium enclense]SDC03723.1 L-asparaginase [Exiguobacterium enclense]
MKSLLLIHTGGTIAMAQDHAGHVLPNDINPLDASLPRATDIANITTRHFANLPSPHMTPDIMLRLAHFIESELKKEHYDGVVITHGTDTLEETAYFLHLTLGAPVPIVLTGAMRSSNEVGSDGEFNLITALRVAVSEAARGKGVLVVFNGEIHSAFNVTKTHTSSVDTFKSVHFGNLGMVTKDHVYLFNTPLLKQTHMVTSLSKRVAVLKVYAGMEPDLLLAVKQLGYDGLVLEVLGQGNVPPSIVDAIAELITVMPIVIVSRCFNGIVQDVYGYTGGGQQLKELGVIFSNGLNSQKARLKLMVELEIDASQLELEESFRVE